MSKEYSPFTPGVPVPIDFFVGRNQELTTLVDKAKASSSGKLQLAFVYGERGIGKSSLCRMTRVIAESQADILGVHVFLGGVVSLPEMARRIFEKFLNESINRPWYEQIRSFLGKHVREVGLFGVNIEFDADKKELNQLVNGFSTALRTLVQQLKDKKGLLIILDDSNGLANLKDFANWLKSLIDEISTSDQPLPLFLVLAGLPERRLQLFQSQPSLMRVFDPIEIKKLSEEETKNFYRQSFSKVGISIKEEELATLWQYSGGYPVLAHEIGDAVFKIDMDNNIDKDDAVRGIVKAAHVIGQKYIEPQVYDAIRSQKYHSILRKLARDPFESQFRKKEIAKDLNESEKKVFDNFLQRMKKLGILKEDKEAGSGAYQFTSDLHYLFIWLQAQGN